MALSKVTRRTIDTAAEILGTPEPDHLAFLHSVLAQCSLPYRKPPDGALDYYRRNGRVQMVLTAGHAIDPTTGNLVRQGLPYGAKPRLLLLHLCSEAIRRQSATIPIADSMSALMRDLGLTVTGGKKGSVGRFKEQLNRLSASSMQLAMDYGDRKTVMNPAPIIRQMDLWFPADPGQRTLWPSEVTLSSEFFDTLRDHALPMDPRAIQALQHSARGLDVYSWLAHRLPRVKKSRGDRVSWQALQGQFGDPEADLNTFKKKFIVAMRQVLTVYPGANVDQVTGGLLLRPSPPPIQRTIISTAPVDN